MNPEQRRAIGWTLLAVGVITTVPLVAQVPSAIQEPRREVK
jgi:hypothetical protein